MDCVKIEEQHGGTAGTHYVYLLKGNKLYHISQLPGVKVINKKEGGRRRTIVEWCVPRELLAGSEGVLISFSNRGYSYENYFKLPNNLEGIDTLSFLDMYNKGYIVKNVIQPLRELSRRGVTFEPFGPETNQLRVYETEVPRLVSEIWRELKSMGINSIAATGKAERLLETVYDPIYAELLSMVLPTPQARIMSLSEKNARAVELYILSKVLRALYELGFRPTSDYLSIEFTTNKPAMTMKAKGIGIDVLYQATLIPHAIPAVLHGIPEQIHTTPDIALVLSGERPIGWGELSNIANRVLLITEVKYNLGNEADYETLIEVIKQVKVYETFLKSMPKTIIVIYKNNPAVASKLKAFGIEAVDGVNPDNYMGVRGLIELVKRIIKDRLQRTL